MKPPEREHERWEEEREQMEPPEHAPEREVRPSDQQRERDSGGEGQCHHARGQSRGAEEELPGPACPQHLGGGACGRWKLRHERNQGEQCRDDQDPSRGSEQE